MASMADTLPATVHLVGAGPGDPELLTIKAARLTVRAAALALMYLAGPKAAAEVLYRTADEMADATQAVK